MSLTDIMSQAGLAAFAEIGLALFFLVFVAVVVRTMLHNRQEMEECARLAIEDDEAIENTRSVSP